MREGKEHPTWQQTVTRLSYWREEMEEEGGGRRGEGKLGSKGRPAHFDVWCS